MRTHYLLLLNAVSLACFAQKSEEDAIKKVIEQETTSYVQKNYDAWSNTWAHDTAAFYVRAANFGRTELRGWNAVAATHKRNIDNLAILDETDIARIFSKSEHQILINGNTAIVSFKQGTVNPNSITMTLLKQNGSWKILNATVIDSKSYALAETVRMLRNLVGTWEMEPGTVKQEPAQGFEFKSLQIEIKETQNGFEALLTTILKTSDGKTVNGLRGVEYFIPDYYELEMAYMAVQKNQNGQTYASMGKLIPNSDGSFTVKGMYSAKPTATRIEYTISQKDGKCHRISNSYAVDGKKTQTLDYYMHRVVSNETNTF